MTKISNKEIRAKVEFMEEFDNKNSSCYGRRLEKAGLYVVYSYGEHWPLFVYDWRVNQWYENNSSAKEILGYGTTTSRHASHSRPYDLTTSAKANGFIEMSVAEIKEFVQRRIVLN